MWSFRVMPMGSWCLHKGRKTTDCSSAPWKVKTRPKREPKQDFSKLQWVWTAGKVILKFFKSIFFFNTRRRKGASHLQKLKLEIFNLGNRCKATKLERWIFASRINPVSRLGQPQIENHWKDITVVQLFWDSLTSHLRIMFFWSAIVRKTTLQIQSQHLMILSLPNVAPARGMFPSQYIRKDHSS